MGELAALGAALSWAISSVLLKPLSHRFHPVALNGLRCVAAALFFAFILILSGKKGDVFSIPAPAMLALVLGSVAGIAVGESLFIYSLRFIDVSRAYPISICGYPVVTILLAALLLGEVFTQLTLLGMAVVVLGISLVAFPRGTFGAVLSSPQERWGLFLIFLTIVLWGVGTVLIRQGVRESDPIAANFVRIFGTALFIFLFTARRWGQFVGSRGGWRFPALGAATGLLSFGIGGLLFLIGLQLAGAGKTSLLSSVSPLFSVPLAVLFLKERVTLRLALGVIISIAGIWLVMLK
jgi:DME family drug/metabolite transporter